MGAYAATAFARLIPGATVLAFSLQSTLAADLAGWETRFPAGRAQDWAGRFRDATEGLSDAREIFIAYDPDMIADQRHALRYSGDNVTYLQTWFSDHK